MLKRLALILIAPTLLAVTACSPEQVARRAAAYAAAALTADPADDQAIAYADAAYWADFAHYTEIAPRCAESYHAALEAGFAPSEWPIISRVQAAESGCTDSAVGPYNERGRMQIHPRSWCGALQRAAIVGADCLGDLAVMAINLRAAFYVATGH